LVEEVGFANTTTDAIAERAGASKATIYRWWSNKAAVLIAALNEQVGHELPFPNTGDLRKDIDIQLQNFITLLTSRRGGLFKAFIAAAQSDAEVAEAFRAFWIRPRRAEASVVLRQHQKRRAMKPDLDPGAVLDLIYGPIYFRLLAGHAPLTLEFARQISEMAVIGLSEPGTGNAGDGSS
jgi:AcrR family transcriptional regulator